VDSFQVSIAYGLSPNARQIRDTADCDIPVAAAIERVDQWVSCPRVSSRLLTITASTASSVITRGRPGRGSSDSPPSRSVRNRDRHCDTVPRETPSRVDTAPIVAAGSVHANTIRGRNANAEDYPVASSHLLGRFALPSLALRRPEPRLAPVNRGQRSQDHLTSV
jgi:hypothetical protein